MYIEPFRIYQNLDGERSSLCKLAFICSHPSVAGQARGLRHSHPPLARNQIPPNPRPPPSPARYLPLAPRSQRPLTTFGFHFHGVILLLESRAALHSLSSGVQEDRMAPTKCLQSQVLTLCSGHQVVFCKKSPLCSPRAFLVPATSSSLSSFLAAPNHTSSSLLNRLSCGTFVCAHLPKTPPSHTKSASFSGKLQQRRSGRLAHLENDAWKLAGEIALQKRCLRVIAKANDSTADDAVPSEMSLENALKLLGVREGASFEEILRAKKVMLDRSGGDQEQVIQVETAYDLLLMQSLSQRRSGKVVDSAVRYADVRKPKSSSSGGGLEWLQKVLKSAPVSFQTPPTSEIGIQTGLFAALIVWTFATGVMSPPSEGAVTGQDTPGFILAVGFGLALFFLRKQNIKLGKATLITIGGLVSGALLGGLVQSWLRVDIVPVFGIGSPAIVVSEFVLFSLWVSSLYLR